MTINILYIGLKVTNQVNMRLIKTDKGKGFYILNAFKKYNNVKNQDNIPKFLLSAQTENFIDLHQKK